uniref:Pyrroline-5-carboxylate reductase n=1 Tax=Angiostrongylus cantonensis TaxID=6313 RepID=A0A0K0CZB5_ANGCA
MPLFSVFCPNFQGAAQMVLATDKHPASLKDKICSPGGTTISGLRKLEEFGFRSAVIEAVIAATDRANSMS